MDPAFAMMGVHVLARKSRLVGVLAQRPPEVSVE